MDDELMQTLLTVMTDAGQSEDSSHEIAFHLALHFPTHARALLDYQPEPEPEPEPEPQPEPDPDPVPDPA